MVVCVLDDTGVDIEALDQAVAWWVGLGHQVELGCPGSVRLEADETLRELGLTHARSNQGLMVEATIRVRPKARALVIAHELGHALGYEHPPAPPSGHMMHPTRPGWDSRGLEDEP